MALLPQHGVAIERRFWAKVEDDPGSGCWIWTGAQNNRQGYGAVRIGKQRYLAHRAAFTIAFGSPGPDDLVLHRCDNPRCVNPDHLFVGTQADNVHDMIVKGRHCHGDAWRARNLEHLPRGEDHPNSKLTWADVALIRDAMARGGSVNGLARRFGVSARTISNVRDRKAWVRT